MPMLDSRPLWPCWPFRGVRRPVGRRVPGTGQRAGLPRRLHKKGACRPTHGPASRAREPATVERPGRLAWAIRGVRRGFHGRFRCPLVHIGAEHEQWVDDGSVKGGVETTLGLVAGGQSERRQRGQQPAQHVRQCLEAGGDVVVLGLVDGPVVPGQLGVVAVSPLRRGRGGCSRSRNARSISSSFDVHRQSVRFTPRGQAARSLPRMSACRWLGCRSARRGEAAIYRP